MKVVLIKDVKDMGRAGSVQEVSAGHALNMLLPRKLAIAATPGNLKRAELMEKQSHDRKELDKKLISDRVAALAEERIVITKKANEQGHLYDAVDAAEIAAATQLPEEAIGLLKPIKELGTFEIPVAAGENFGTVSIAIEAE